MSSGNFTNGKIELFTNFCVEKKVEKSKLISLLKDRFGLDCSIDIRKQNSYPSLDRLAGAFVETDRLGHGIHREHEPR